MADTEREAPSKWREWFWDHPFMRVGGSSEDGFFFFKIYGNRFYGARWFKLTVMPLYRLFRSFHNAKWWLKWRLVPRHRYHVVNTGLRPGYYDEDTLILNACMALLCRYVEWHGGDKKLDEFSADLRREADANAPEGLQASQADRQDEATAIYRWWKVEKPADEARRGLLLSALYGRKDRVTWKKDEKLPVYEMVFKEFEGDEIQMHEEFRRVERKIEDDEQAMLHRLVAIRRSLWT